MAPPPPALDREQVRLLDRLCTRAWAPLEQVEMDGWVLRAAGGFSLRANSVWPRDATGAVPLEQRLRRAEAFYAERGLPTHFQISPAAAPAELEQALVRRGYRVHTATDVMLARAADTEATCSVSLLEEPSDAWRQVMLDSADDESDARGRLAIVERIPLPRRHALVMVDGEAAAIGLGVLDGGWVGIFAMRTHPRFRRRGLARSVVATLRRWATSEGCLESYLQVETDNAAAIALYRGLGFTRAYGYSYWSPEK